MNNNKGIRDMTYNFYSKGFEFSYWFRLGSGLGFSIANTKPIHSERSGSRRAIRVLGVKFEIYAAYKVLEI